jgi:DNA polymerase I-like protein with 3'-5' exonuclease and polymerase domains
LKPFVTVDFETHAITGNPWEFPPEPVGVAIEHENRPAFYLGWGHHRCENNSTYDEASLVLGDIWAAAQRGELDIVCHNAKFDLHVAQHHFGLPVLPWQRVHDTMFLAYLIDPHALKIDLKHLAEQHLDWPPEERDEIAEWLWEHRAELYERHGKRVTGKHGKAGKPGEWLWAAPCDLVGKYAIGDVRRTTELYKWMREVVKQGRMWQAYNRERKLLPILMENERDGMRVDVERLAEDTAYYGEVLEYVDNWLRKRLKSPGLSLDNDADVAYVFDEQGIVKPEDWDFTKTGRKWRAERPHVAAEDVPAQYRSVAKDKLPPHKYQDQKVAQAFGYRNRLSTCLKMFMRPWLEQAQHRGGYISTSWNQTRGGDGGTRTGRPSTSNPNFLNLSKSFEGRTDGYKHPDFLDVDPLPLVRQYILPDSGHVFLHRDFSGQEVRIFAHFEMGELMEAYQANPDLDPHTWLKDIILELTGVERERTKVKNVTFLRLYGGGKYSVMAQLHVTEQEAKELLAAHDKALPGRKGVVDNITALVRSGKPIRTWGGRMYFPEPRRMVDGKMRSFEYKLINYLVQGSAADVTKECLIRWYNHPDRDPRTRFMVTVYDEINITCPEEVADEQMEVLRHCMEDIELDVPMLTEGGRGPNWAELEDCA